MSLRNRALLVAVALAMFVCPGIRAAELERDPGRRATFTGQRVSGRSRHLPVAESRRDPCQSARDRARRPARRGRVSQGQAAKRADTVHELSTPTCEIGSRICDRAHVATLRPRRPRRRQPHRRRQAQQLPLHPLPRRQHRPRPRRPIVRQRQRRRQPGDSGRDRDRRSPAEHAQLRDGTGRGSLRGHVDQRRQHRWPCGDSSRRRFSRCRDGGRGRDADQPHCQDDGELRSGDGERPFVSDSRHGHAGDRGRRYQG